MDAKSAVHIKAMLKAMQVLYKPKYSILLFTLYTHSCRELSKPELAGD